MCVACCTVDCVCSTFCRKRKAPRADAYLNTIHDRKLKGKLRHREHVYADAQKSAIKINDWLAPSEGGFLQPEGSMA